MDTEGSTDRLIPLLASRSQCARMRPEAQLRSLFVIIPAYNEARAIGATLAALPRSVPGIDRMSVVVVDDGSTDDTAEVVRRCGDERVVLLRHRINRGLGGALGTGLEYARRNGADLAVTYDADGQHAPDDLPRVIEPLVAGKAEAVIGSRLLTRKGMPWYRIIGKFGLNIITCIFFGLWTTDSQSGLRAFSKSAMERIDIRNDRMEVSSEFIREIRRKRLKFSEVPIQAIYTDYSLAKGQRNWNAFNIIFRLLLQRLMED
jgi:glycosyltransferase involved in cell wall biosynthesis